MLAAVKTIQKGNFDVRIPLYGEDEIDELAQEINIMSAKINDLINTVCLSENLQKESQLAALQSQINPHFLFNTLETMKMAAELGETERLKTGFPSLGGYTGVCTEKGTDPATDFTAYFGEQHTELLKDPSLKIYEIAERIGFQNEKYYMKAFKTVVGNPLLSISRTATTFNRNKFFDIKILCMIYY